MFDFHMHSTVSFDGKSTPREMIAAAEKLGLREICFTDHYDPNDIKGNGGFFFDPDNYRRLYSEVSSNTVAVRHGVEYGLTLWNKKELSAFCSEMNFDFVIGSVHFAGGTDPYFPDFWEGRTVRQAFERYLVQTLECVKIHDGFDVLGHLNYVCKSPYNPTHEQLCYKDFSDICDEIMRTLVHNGKGMEINTSGVDRVGDFLPAADFIKRYRELGGEIITVGSDAHNTERVGQYIDGALAIAKEIFGYVCTFEGRRPIYHKL